MSQPNSRDLPGRCVRCEMNGQSGIVDVDDAKADNEDIAKKSHNQLHKIWISCSAKYVVRKRGNAIGCVRTKAQQVQDVTEFTIEDAGDNVHKIPARRRINEFASRTVR